MKNKILIFVIIMFMVGCYENKNYYKNWKNISFIKEKTKYKNNIDWDKVKVGDILIQETNGTFLGWFGHCGIVVAKNAVAEIPKLGTSVYYRDINDWKQMRRVAVLRYKNIDNKLREIIFYKVKDSIGKPYGFTSKKGKTFYYCSQYVWNIFYESGKEVGKNIDLDYNGGFWVLPYDIFNSEELEIVDIMEEEEK